MSIFQQFIKSIYSPQTIATFRFQGIGKTILYVLVLMLITTSVIGYQLTSSISTMVHDFQADLKNELPSFELKNGVLKSDLEEPLYIPQNGIVFIFDTTGSISSSDIKTDYANAVALLETEAVIVTNNVAEIVKYRELGNFTLTKQDVEEFTVSIVDLLPLMMSIVALFLYLFLTTLKFIGISFLSLLGLIMRRNTKLTLSYKQVWILSAYAVTLPTVFFAITDALSIYIPYAFTLYWVVAVIMLYLTFKEIPKPGNDEEEINNQY